MSIEGRLSKKLYDPRTIEEMADTDTFKVVNELYTAFKERPEFIGIDPMGSTMKGYATDESDIDVHILIDFGVDDIIDNIDEVTATTNSFRDKAEELSTIFKVERGRDIHSAIFIVNKSENTKRIKQFLQYDERDAFIVGSFFRNIKGDKISEYRDQAIRDILELDQGTQKVVVKKMAHSLSKEELLNVCKIEDRAEEQFDRSELRTQRSRMWEERIWKALGNTGGTDAKH